MILAIDVLASRKVPFFNSFEWYKGIETWSTQLITCE